MEGGKGERKGKGGREEREEKGKEGERDLAPPPPREEHFTSKYVPATTVCQN